MQEEMCVFCFVYGTLKRQQKAGVVLRKNFPDKIFFWYWVKCKVDYDLPIRSFSFFYPCQQGLEYANYIVCWGVRLLTQKEWGPRNDAKLHPVVKL